MQTSKIRELIHAEHATLREMLKEIEDLAASFETGSRDAGSALRAKGVVLYERFESHLELEDRLLKPALESSGPAGARGARHLEHEHREQRELIRYLLGRLSKHEMPTLLIARELQHFVEYLRLDMAHEESDLLTDEILGTSAEAS